ncbi:BspA family leucine-rich repeat surface protein [Williamsoniiplasma lucivorax]|uniref:Chitinase n=1 Tax=Williamsoniiplasma lucivorax TaxID=209274 RepID=A0A2S5RET5_9MOLU|nr:BspA family leucine-rich repeat surface protein [Williamsoniiplasma lucivorax]PPE05824.1 chitinase [Williamsoniiplasma lucivorax]
MKKLLVLLNGIFVASVGIIPVVGFSQKTPNITNSLIKEEKININTLLDITDLGDVANAEINNLEKIIKIKNPNLKNAFFKMNITSSSTVLIKGIDEYSGEVTVTFNNLNLPNPNPNELDISKLIGIKNLGIIPNKKNSTIKKNILVKNPAAEEAEFSMEINVNKKEVKLEGENKYFGEVTIKFDLPKSKVNINEILKIADLGSVPNIEKKTIENLLNAKNPELTKATYNVEVLSPNAAFIIGYGNYTGRAEIKFNNLNLDKPEDNERDISKLILIRDLGDIPNAKDSTIKKNILAKNPGAEKAEFSMESLNRARKMTLEGEGEYYGKVDISFNPLSVSPSPQKNIKDVIKNQYLGEIGEVNILTIRNAILQNNPEAASATFDIVLIDNTSAKIIGNGLYVGEVIVNFKSSQAENNIEKLITKTYIGYLNFAKDDDIKEGILDKNPAAGNTNFEIYNIQSDAYSGTAKVRGIKPNYGNVIIKFDLKKDINELAQTLKWKTDLGLISNPTSESIKHKFQVINNILENNNISFEITNITKTSAILKGVGIYKGQIELTFINETIENEIQNLKRELQKLVYEKENEWWYGYSLEAAIRDKGIAPMGSIKVTEGRYNEKWKTKEFIFVSTDNNISLGELRVFQVLNKENQTNTIFIDPLTGEINGTNSIIPEKTKIIAHIGSYNTVAHKLPNTVIEVPNYIIKKITSLNSLFKDAHDFNGDITLWDTSNIIYMDFMFNGSWKFNQNIGKWQVSKVISMSNMFNDASSFNQNISQWETSKVRNMNSMFRYASSFNQNLSNWNVKQVSNAKEFALGTNLQGNWLPKFNFGVTKQN